LKSAFILLANFFQKIEMKKLGKSGNEVILGGEVSIAKKRKRNSTNCQTFIFSSNK
jgi:hypothetical protein